MLSALSPIKHLQDLDEQERKLSIDRALTLQKAYNSGDVNTIYKAEQYYSSLQKRTDPNYARAQSSNNPVKALMLDPQEVATSMGYYGKRGMLSDDGLRKMARTPVISAILRTRGNQVADHLKPQPDKYSKGFLIKKRGVSKDEELTDNDKRVIESLTEFMMNCGERDSKWKWDKLDIFGRKVIADSLTLDKANFEIVPYRYRSMEPYCFVAVDAATMMIADSYDNETHINDSAKVNGEYPSYVQVYQNNIIREFYPWEMCFGIRNPSTDINANGYGRSELEDLITNVTGMLNADQYNSAFFRQGSSPKGMLMIKKPGAALNGDRIAEFRKSWNAQMSGVANCIHGDTLIWTKEFGGLEIENVLRGKEEQFITIWTGLNWEKGRAFKTIDEKFVNITRLNNGAEIKTSPDHKFAIVNDKDEFEWKVQSDLKIGDRVLVSKESINQNRKQSSKLHNDRILNKFSKNTIEKYLELEREIVVELTQTEEKIQMFDVEVFNEVHAFIGNEILIHNSHKVPILDAEGFEWIDMQQSNRDMEFFKYIEYLVKVGCAVFNISPEEIGFPLEGQGGGGLGGSDSGKEEKEYSKDKGLKPLLTSLQGWINDFIIGPKTNFKYEFVFQGINTESAKEEEDKLTKAATVYMTVDEVRKEKGLRPLPNGMGKFPLNPIIAQKMMMDSQTQQGQQQQDQEDQGKQDQQDKDQFDNTNPFLDKGQKEDSPFVKAFNSYVEKELIVS